MQYLTGLFFLLILFCQFVLADGFIPIPIDKQLSEAHGIVYAEYIDKSYVKLPSGKVSTSLSFKLIKIAGFEQNEIINANNFRISHPGGVWQGIVHHARGTPDFRQGEKVILILEKDFGGLKLKNLAASKYVILKEDGQKYVVSELFPNHPLFGKMKFSEFEDVVMDVYGMKFLEINRDKYISKKLISGTKRTRRMRSRRMPASSSEDFLERKDASRDDGMFWPLLIFAVLGLYTVFFIRNRGHR